MMIEGLTATLGRQQRCSGADQDSRSQLGSVFGVGGLPFSKATVEAVCSQLVHRSLLGLVVPDLLECRCCGPDVFQAERLRRPEKCCRAGEAALVECPERNVIEAVGET